MPILRFQRTSQIEKMMQTTVATKGEAFAELLQLQSRTDSSKTWQPRGLLNGLGPVRCLAQDSGIAE